MLVPQSGKSEPRLDGRSRPTPRGSACASGAATGFWKEGSPSPQLGLLSQPKPALCWACAVCHHPAQPPFRSWPPKGWQQIVVAAWVSLHTSDSFVQFQSFPLWTLNCASTAQRRFWYQSPGGQGGSGMTSCTHRATRSTNQCVGDAQRKDNMHSKKAGGAMGNKGQPLQEGTRANPDTLSPSPGPPLGLLLKEVVILLLLQLAVVLLDFPVGFFHVIIHELVHEWVKVSLVTKKVDKLGAIIEVTCGQGV